MKNAVNGFIDEGCRELYTGRLTSYFDCNLRFESKGIAGLDSS